MNPSTRSQTIFQVSLCLTAVLILILSGCRGATKTVQPGPPTQPPAGALNEKQTPTKGTAGQPATQGTAVAAVQATTAATATVSQTDQVAAATAQACPPPQGWVQHTVRQDETLFYYATKTGVTVDEVMRANCLTTDFLQVGQKLYLPSIPPIRPTFAPPAPQVVSQPESQPQIVPTTCASSFSCPKDLPPLDLAAGQPGDPNFKPCSTVRADPWIHVSDNALEAGERFYFFACDYPNPPTRATITKPDGTAVDVPLLTEMPDQDLEYGPADALVNWPVLPGQPEGEYKVTIYGPKDGLPEGAFDDQIFYVDPPTQPHILVMPVSGTPGAKFFVYYVNFDFNATLPVNLYGEDHPVVKQEHHFTGRASFLVKMDQPLASSPGKGWALQVLQSAESDPHSGYMIEYNHKEVIAMFWLE